MSANTLNGLTPTIYAALDVVSRELTGGIRAVSIDPQASRASVGQLVSSPVAPVLVSENISPSNVSPNTAGIVSGLANITITKSKAVPFNFDGPETAALSSALGTAPYETLKRDLIAQAVRQLTNEMEADIVAVMRNSSRAFGTAGTTPFATAGDMGDVANVLKILKDNGAPQSDLRLVLNTTAGANLMAKQSNLFKVNEAGSDAMLRNGSLGRLMGLDLGESGGITSFTKGTGASYTSTAAGFAVGTTSIPLITGTGTILAGDVVTFAGDTNRYVVATGIAAPGTIVLQAPGLRQAIPASATAVTVGNSYTPSFAFHKSAFQLVARMPPLPEGGDAADDRMNFVDPVTGMSLEFSVYRQYRQVRYEVAASWGVAAIKPAHAAMLLG
jgi:hypothetical protein